MPLLNPRAERAGRAKRCRPRFEPAGLVRASADRLHGLLRFAVAACGRRLDDHRLARIDHGGIGAFELLPPPIVAPHPVLADLARLAAGQSERTDAAMA